VLTILSVLQIGWWIPDFLTGLFSYADYAHPVWAIGLIESLPLRILTLALVVGATLWMALRFVRERASDVDWIVTAILAVLLLVPQTGNYYLVLLIPVLIVCFKRAPELQPSYTWGIRLACVAAVFSPWLYAAQFPGLETLGLPLHMALIWACIQRQSLEGEAIDRDVQWVHDRL
jgi:hypothetical protein